MNDPDSLSDLEIAPEPNTDAERNALQGPTLCARSLCAKPAKASRGHGAFCSDTCRSWVHRNPWDDRRRKKKVLVTRRTHGPEFQRYSRCARAILERLRLGPATAIQLMNYGSGVRYSARIFELRNGEPAHDIRLLDYDPETGRTEYGLFVDGILVKP